MSVLVVQSNETLSRLWAKHIEQIGSPAQRAPCLHSAVEAIRTRRFGVLIVDLDLPENGALSVADFANYCQPEARVILVTARSFFSDGSIFKHVSNACAFLPASTPARDIAVMANHFATT